MACADAVRGLKATAGDNAVELTWDAPTGVDPTAYYVRVTPEARLLMVTAPVTKATISGLRNGIEYSFTMYAATDGGVSAPTSPVSAIPTNGIEGEVAGLIVAFEPGVAVTNNQSDVPGGQAVSSVGLKIESEIAPGMHLVELSEPVPLSQAREISKELASDTRVAWAEPDEFVFTAAVDSASSTTKTVLTAPSDAQYATAQWNLWDTYGVGLGDGTRTMSRFYSPRAGAGARVGIIDTGVSAHPDLAGQLIPGYDFVSDPAGLAAPRTQGGADVSFDADDQPGRDADPSDPGDWRGVAPVRTSSWHGTHIAGVIAAATNNTEGIAGIVPGAKLQPIRALSWRGGLMSDIAASIAWASGGHVDGVPDNEQPVDVINMSFAVNAPCSIALQTAIDDAASRGALMVAAAGNANDNVSNYAPANCGNVIAVAATGRDGLRAPYSNFGAGIDIAAPGGSGTGEGGVLSTVNAGEQGPTAPSYGVKEGTSIAAAHVTAAAAYLVASSPNASPAELTTILTGRSAVRTFAQATCDSDATKSCGTGILDLAQIASAGEPGVSMTLTFDGKAIAEGSAVASNSVVGVGTAGLLSPGTGNRVLKTSLPSGTAYRAGSAVAPEGWTINYSTNGGSSWSATEPATASDVTDVRASANVSAGLIEGSAQVYSSETTSAIPSSSFSASTGGDGWGVTFYDDYIFNVFHHQDSSFMLACHVRSTGNRCPAFSSGYILYSGYAAAMRSDVAVDQSTGKLYGFTYPTSGTYANRPGLLCLDVTKVATSAPTSCGFIPLSNTADVTSYGHLSDLVSVGRRIFGVESASANSLLCFDAATGAMCPGSPVAVDGDSGASWGSGGSRAITVGNRVFVRTSTHIYCYQATDLQECSNADNWPVAITRDTSDPQVAVHTNASGTPDGVCSLNQCVDLTGQLQGSWTNPFTLGTGGNQWAYSGVTTVGRFYWSVFKTMRCFDFATNAACAGFSSPSWGQLYMVEVDPQNPACLWTNSDEGAIKILDAYTGNIGCSGNPVITLQPSQFAPRYACSTSSGIVEWTSLRLVSLGGGGSASSVSLTVRDANGEAVSGWSNKAVPVTPGANPLGELDMTGLDPAVSGSRPTFSFTFSGITGSITTAVIALDYKGRGPELCLDVTASTATPPQLVTVTGTLTEAVGAPETFATERSFTIGATSSIVSQGVPTAPRSLAGSGLNTTATLSFQTPSSDGGSPITGYQISADGGGSWTAASLIVNPDGSLSSSISGLTPGQTYSVKVAAVNAIGRGTAASISIEAQLLSIGTLVDVPLNQGPVTLSASSSGRSVTYTASPSSVCTAGGTGGRTITLVAVGTCNLVAFQAGDTEAVPVILPAETPGSFRVLPPYYETTVPGVPTELLARPASGQVLLSWTAPVNNGNSAITDYSVQYKSGGSWIPFIDGVSTSTSTLVTGLTNGTTYSFRVAATNSVGTGAYTSSITSTPATVPGPPTSLAAAAGSGASRALSWAAPASTGGSPITDYLVEYKLATDGTWTIFTDGVSASTSATVAGLTEGLAYDFQVTTVNAVGASDPTNTVTLSAVPGNEQVTLAWPAPDGVVVDYRIDVRIGTGPWTTFADEVTTTTGGIVTGLTNGTTYNFRVAAMVDPVTVASYTSVIAATPRTVPAAPTDVTATPGNRQVSLSWTPPQDGGTAIIDYVVEYRTTVDGLWATFVDGTSAEPNVIVTGLLNGTSYDFRLTSANVVGASEVSSAVTAVPRTVPGAPGVVTATPGAGRLLLSWSAPSTTGAAPITDYVIEYKLATGLSWSIAPHSASTATTFTVTGLVAASYNVRVAAVNAAGTGAYTTTISATPDAPPVTPSTDPPSDPVQAEAAPPVVQVPGPVSPPVIAPSTGGVILINGVPANVNLQPSSDATGWVVRGPDFAMQFKPQAANQPNIELGPQRQLSVPLGGWVLVNGDGYQASTSVTAYLIRQAPDSRVLAARAGQVRSGTSVESAFAGKSDVRPDGTFTIRVEVSSMMNPDDYVLQVNGLSPSSALRSVNMALSVTAGKAASSDRVKIERSGFFSARSAVITLAGKRKLSALAGSIPVGATGVEVSVTTSSNTLSTRVANLALARDRASGLVRELRQLGIDATYSTAVSPPSPRGPATSTVRISYSPATL